MQQAKGVFIVPTYGRVALGVGGSGGAGVLLVKRDDGTWSDPAFYNIGGISVGVQAGAEGGPIAMVLNNEKGVSRFMQKNNFSLSADAAAGRGKKPAPILRIEAKTASNAAC